MKSQKATILTFLTLIVTLMTVLGPHALAQGPEHPEHTVYLPFITTSSPSPLPTLQVYYEAGATRLTSGQPTAAAAAVHWKNTGWARNIVWYKRPEWPNWCYSNHYTERTAHRRSVNFNPYSFIPVNCQYPYFGAYGKYEMLLADNFEGQETNKTPTILVDFDNAPIGTLRVLTVQADLHPIEERGSVNLYWYGVQNYLSVVRVSEVINNQCVPISDQPPGLVQSGRSLLLTYTPSQTSTTKTYYITENGADCDTWQTSPHAVKITVTIP